MTSPAPSSTGLELRGLACRRGGRTLFDGLNLRLESGAALILKGPNGSGKTSLLRLLAGLLPAFVGEVLWRGTATRDDREAWQSAMRFLGHDNAVKPALSVAQNLDFWTRLHPPVVPGAVARGLEARGLGDLGDLPAVMLSAGRRRRLALARLAAAPGEVWLMDEPTVTLDAGAIDRLAAMVAGHRAAGGIVVVATHDAFTAPGAVELELGGRP
jgi:heme exporter protein A